MTLYENIKSRIQECLKNGNSEERNILKTLVGEIQAKALSLGVEPTDELTEKTIASFRQNAIECLKYSNKSDSGELESLYSNFEIETYDKFMPKYESIEGIIELLKPNVEQLMSAKADGPATGMAMGMLKKVKAKVQGKDVLEAVKIIRSDK